MTIEVVKSAALIIEDLITPPGAVLGGVVTGSAASSYRPGAGLGEKGELCEVNGFVTPAVAATSPSIYQFVRVPSKSVIKHIFGIVSAATPGTFTGYLTLYYSTDTQDGTLSALQGTLVNSLSGAAALFTPNAYALGGQTNGVPVELTFLNSQAASGYNFTRANQPLWQAAGLAGDPGGYFDIVFVTTSNNATFVSLNVDLHVQYMAPGTP